MKDEATKTPEYERLLEEIQFDMTEIQSKAKNGTLTIQDVYKLETKVQKARSVMEAIFNKIQNDVERVMNILLESSKIHEA